jgi:hypothetical protein
LDCIPCCSLFDYFNYGLWRRFLAVEVPEQPFPRKNNRDAMKGRAGITLLKSATPMMTVVVAVSVVLWLGVQRLGAK